jgi:predicted amidohydrolase YtcJ
VTNQSQRAFAGSRILTMDPSYPRPDVVVIDQGRIAAVGERALLAAYPGIAVEDLGRRTLVPGFIDAHNHLSIAALHPLWADLSGVTSIDALQAALREQARREPHAHWVRGVGWSETVAGLLPERRDLDALVIDRPVIVVHFSLHQCVVNSRALDELGIGRTTPDPAGGTIVRDANGEPTGLLIERAWSAAHARSLAAYSDPDRWAEHIAARARTLIRDGITGVHDAACAPSAEAVYRTMAKAHTLPISVLLMPHAEAILTPPPAGRLDGPITGDGDEQLRVGPLKLFADGGIAPAIDGMTNGIRLTMGVQFDDLAEQLVRAVSRGFRVAVHAMGNAGLAAALSAFTRAARVRHDDDHRFRIEHGTLASPAQIQQMAALGAVGVVQPGFVNHMGALVEGLTFDEEIWMPFGAMADAGIRLAASSDDPCAIHEPLRTSVHGATRRTGSGAVLGSEQAIDYEDWLRAYTAGAAYAGGQEHERGTLTPGKRADLVVLDGDLDPLHPPRVAQTWIAGERVYAAA